MPLQIFKPSYRPADCTYLVQYIAQFQLAEGNVSFSGFKAIRAIAVKIAVQNRVQSCFLAKSIYPEYFQHLLYPLAATMEFIWSRI